MRRSIRSGVKKLRPVEVEEPNEQVMRRIRARMAEFDSLEEPLADLINEYGYDRAMRAARLYYGRWDDCRRYLEIERSNNEKLRWEVCGGTLPPGF